MKPLKKTKPKIKGYHIPSLNAPTKKGSIRRVLEERKKRIPSARTSGIKGSKRYTKFTGIGAGMGSLLHLIESGKISKVSVAVPIAFTSVVAAAEYAGHFGKGYNKASKAVNKATRQVSRGLATTAAKSPDLIDFLGSYKFITIDRKGMLRGTNRERKFGIGRMRLSTKGILKGTRKVAEKRGLPKTTISAIDRAIRRVRVLEGSIPKKKAA